MFVISGQAKSSLTIRKTQVDVRALGPQEFDILSTLKYGAKYADSVMDAKNIRYCLERGKRQILRLPLKADLVYT